MAELFQWENTNHVQSLAYRCWFCSHELTSQLGWRASRKSGTADEVAGIRICHLCTRPTFLYFNEFGRLRQLPAAPPGRHVEHLPPNVAAIYSESRRAAGANAPTAASMALRSLIAYVACEREAPPDLTFKGYVDWLDENGYLPPGGKRWVGRIKDVGNEAAHELQPIPPPDVELLLDFAELLLRFVYEAPGRLEAAAEEAEN